MSISFPSVAHIQLENPPLTEVICQVRFPAILQISPEDISMYQKAVREQFPRYAVEQQIGIELLAQNASSRKKIHRFRDKANETTLSFSDDFFSVNTTKYQGWKHFANNLGLASDVMLSVFDLSHTTRIGLRYVNKLTLINTGKTNFSELVSLMRPELTSLLRAEVLSNPVMLTHIRDNFDDNIFSFRFGAIKEASEEKTFLLDFDLYTEEVLDLSIDNILNQCDYYHDIIYNAFQWSFSDEIDVESLFSSRG